QREGPHTPLTLARCSRLPRSHSHPRSRRACHLPSAICHLSSVICHLPSVICHLQSVICNLPFLLPHSPFRIPHFLAEEAASRGQRRFPVFGRRWRIASISLRSGREPRRAR